ncbi:MAG: M3 family metallopeptidase [Rikenellaceae bacterium]|nr:M3 family metallopeptidase [Rikenellaceae bacterium]
MTVISCSTGNNSENPLLSDFNTPYGVPPFDKIKTEHYLPAFEESIRLAREEIGQIVDNPAAPDFYNTIEALERSGRRLETVSSVFFNLNECLTNDVMQNIALEVMPKLTEFSNDIQLDPKLFGRVKTAYETTDKDRLTAEQRMLLDKTYKGFIRSGAGLNDEDKEKYRGLTTELSNLSVIFSQNVLAATNGFFLHLTDSADLAGLPESAIQAAREEAESRNLEGWVITQQAPSMIPFMQYAENRGLREQLWHAYNTRGIGGEHDNTELIKRIADLRQRIANLLGFETYADYVLAERMAGSRQAVNEFLEDLLERSLPHAKNDYFLISEYAKEKGHDGKLMPWDWSFWSEKYKDEFYSINDEITRPYFKLESVENGMFLLANKLYGLTFKENRDIPVYYPEVKAFEVYDGDGSFLAVLYIDYFPRASKRGGAWMTSFRDQYKENGEDIRPVISLVCNFTKPTSTTPSLLTYSEAETILHEFGHALHGILAEGTYSSLSGTSVYRDFVELPSQFMENFFSEKEYLDLWAEHYETGEKIPEELIEKIKASQKFLSGYANVRQLTFGINDMAWHSITEPITVSAEEFEKNATSRAQILPSVPGTAMSPAFSHIFAGGYAAGYYGYKWAEVLDADAYSVFKNNGIFDKTTATSFRENILSKGGSEPPMELYVRFRGHKPTADAFLEREGLK